MNQNENLISIIEVIKEETQNKTDISSGNNSTALNTAIIQLNDIFREDNQIDFSNCSQRTLVYLLAKLLDICIKIDGDTVVYNFEITYLCIQCLQQFQGQYQEIDYMLTHDITQDDDEKGKSINFLEVASKYLNIQIPTFIMDQFIIVIQEVSQMFPVEIFDKIGLDKFIDLFSIIDKLEASSRNKIINIIKRMVQNSSIDATYSKYLERFLNLAVHFVDQLRQNDIANDIIDIQYKILKKIMVSEGSSGDSQDTSSQLSDESENIISFEYANAVFLLIMKLSYPVFKTTDVVNSQKAFKFDGEKKLFKKLVAILIIICSNKNGFRYAIELIQSPPDINFDSICSTQYSQSSQSTQFDNTFDFAKLLFVFRDRPVIILQLIFRIFKSVIRFCFNSNEESFKEYMEKHVIDENKEETSNEEESENENNLFEDEDNEDYPIGKFIEICTFISKSVQPILFDIAVSPVQKEDLFYTFRCLSYSLSYFIPHNSKITNMFLFVLQGFVLNKKNLILRPMSSNNFNNQGLFGHNFNNANVFRNNFGNNNFNQMNNFGNNNFNFPFFNNNNNNNNNNQVNDSDKNSNSKITYNYTNINSDFLTKQITLRILISFKNLPSILDSFFLDILKPNKEESKNELYVKDYNKFSSMVEEFNSQKEKTKYTKAKLKKVTFDQVIELIKNSKISKTNFLKQGFVNHCIDLVKDLQGEIKNIDINDNEEFLEKIKILIKYCFSLLKIIPVDWINGFSITNKQLVLNGLQNGVDYQYKSYMFHLHHFDSLSMIEGLINLKEQNLNRDNLVIYSQSKPEVVKLIKTRLNELAWPSQFALFYRAFEHPEYKKKGINVNGKVYSHMDSQYRVMAEQKMIRSSNISCSSVNEDKKRKTIDSRGYSILTIPEMQVKNVHEYSEVLSLLTKLHEVFISNKLFKLYYENQSSGMKNNYINYDVDADEEVFEEEEDENNEYNEYSSENSNESTQNESKQESNDEDKTESKDEDKSESKDENKTESKDEDKTESKDEDKTESKDEDKSESNDDDDDEKIDIQNKLVPLFIDKEFNSMIKFLTMPSEVISLKSESLSTILNYPFLFPFHTRATALKLLVFHCQNSISLCEREFTQKDQDEDDEVLQFDEHVVHLVVDRPSKDGNSDEFFKQGCEILKRFAPNPEMFDVEFRNEKGVGKGPTHEFYTLLSLCFCEEKRNLFRSNSSELAEESNYDDEIPLENESNIDIEMDIGVESRVSSNPAENESKETTSSLSLETKEVVNNNVQYCVDKLGMFPSYKADPLLFEVLGIFCAKAIFMECIVDIYFNPAFFKLCRNKKIKMEEVDPQLALAFNKKQDFVGISQFEFMDVELIENGKDVDVTEENVNEYFNLIEDLNIGKGIQKCVDNFLKGFCQILPFDALSMFSESEISQLLGGSKSVEITNDDFAKNIAYESGYRSNSAAILLFKDLVINDMNDNDRQRLIQFVTGFNRLPIGGFSALKPKVTISRFLPADFHLTKSSTASERIEMQKKIDMMLPTVSTCTRKLRLPPYSSKEIMYQKLDYCMSECGGFQLI